MTRLVLIAILLLLSASSIADESQCLQSKEPLFSISSEELARRGCCSHHGGVCGCEGGRSVCCDGSFSPSCGCHSQEKDILKLDGIVSSNV